MGGLKVLAAAGVLAGGASARAAVWLPGQWYQNPDNGHYYSVQPITGGVTGWLISRSQAQSLTAPDGSPVDLATLTSAAEDLFVFTGIDTPAYWTIDTAGNDEGPNIGGYQFDKLAEPAGHWAWVTGEPFAYTQWNPGEPNNSSGVEDYMTLFSTGSGRTGNWNDIGSAQGVVGAPGNISFYIAESVPEPTGAGAAIACTAAMASRRRR